mmetsp:Transcript_74086/g.122322  ORF Transcript_74086/g.122322 Transcript_74086/m.122322 type:complete len:276 (-) Transcript_74086:1921-2748(-)
MKRPAFFHFASIARPSDGMESTGQLEVHRQGQLRPRELPITDLQEVVILLGPEAGDGHQRWTAEMDLGQLLVVVGPAVEGVGGATHVDVQQVAVHLALRATEAIGWHLPHEVALTRSGVPINVVMRQGLLRLRALELDLARDEARAAVGIAHPLHVAGAKERNTVVLDLHRGRHAWPRAARPIARHHRQPRGVLRQRQIRQRHRQRGGACGVHRGNGVQQESRSRDDMDAVEADVTLILCTGDHCISRHDPNTRVAIFKRQSLWLVHRRSRPFIG